MQSVEFIEIRGNKMKTKKSKPNLCLTCVSGNQNQILTKECKLERTEDCFCLNTVVFVEHAKKEPLEPLMYPLLMVGGVSKCEGYENDNIHTED